MLVINIKLFTDDNLNLVQIMSFFSNVGNLLGRRGISFPLLRKILALKNEVNKKKIVAKLHMALYIIIKLIESLAAAYFS